MQGEPTAMLQGQHEDMALHGWRRAWAAFDAGEKTVPPAMLSPGRLPGLLGTGAADLTRLLSSPEGETSHHHHFQGARGLRLEGHHSLSHGQPRH